MSIQEQHSCTITIVETINPNIKVDISNVSNI